VNSFLEEFGKLKIVIKVSLTTGVSPCEGYCNSVGFPSSTFLFLNLLWLHSTWVLSKHKSYQWFHKPWLSVVRVRGAVYDSALVSISSILSLVSFLDIFSAMEVNVVERI
jgi:hypothetical protein